MNIDWELIFTFWIMIGGTFLMIVLGIVTIDYFMREK